MSVKDLTVVKEKCTRESSSNSGVVVIEGDTIDDVRSNDAQQLALQYASQLGIYRPGLGVNPTAFRVGPDGEPAQKYSKEDKCRCEYEIQGGL